MATADTRPYRSPELKTFFKVLFPAVAVAYFFFWSIYNYENPEIVFGVLAILNLGTVIVLEFLTRIDGQLVIITQDDKRIFSLELDVDPMTIEKRKTITFNVTDKNGEYVDFEAFLEGEGPESQTKHPL